MPSRKGVYALAPGSSGVAEMGGAGGILCVHTCPPRARSRGSYQCARWCAGRNAEVEHSVPCGSARPLELHASASGMSRCHSCHLPVGTTMAVCSFIHPVYVEYMWCMCT
eukprot:TRINITY_DN1964_c4_g1_i1.p3 TRINITY_DN1964_c4_g1~~TRINITY_DN1964_c4_g1_i1.p3  ORF type:complete len:110 (-),score=0.98 TRINITY_DN1964_c4_g1_i1:176-505(-)